MGFLYIIQMGSFNIYKVGIASTNPQQRLAALQTGNPYKLTIVSLYKLEGYDTLERKLHDALAPYRMEGEWFKVDLDIIRKCVEGLATIQRTTSRVAEIIRRATHSKNV